MRSNTDPDRRGIKLNLDDDSFLLEFPNTSEDFMLGFECGEIWACLTDKCDYVQSIISAANAEMIMRMADAAGYVFEAFELPPSAVETLQLGPGDWMSVVMRLKDDEPE